MLPIKTILQPTDFSRHSEVAFQLACSLARDYGARLIVLHVLQPPVSVLGGTEALPPLPVEYGRAEAEAKLHALRSPLPTVRVEHRLREGDAADEILRLAAEAPCDLIVMGTHGRKGVSRLLMGSVAEAVLRKAPCPVLTAKEPFPETSAPAPRQASAST